MPFATVFTCDNVDFTTTPQLGAPGGHDNWHSVRISVQEMGLSNRWIYVELKGATEPALPIVHMALGEGWSLSSDERAMTLIMRGKDAQTRAPVTQKLRFGKATDFWSFMFQVALSRVREYEHPSRERRVWSLVGEASGSH